MINGSLAKHLNRMDEFLVEMKEKIQLRESKHRHEGEIPTSALKEHFIEELCEFFNLPATDAKVLMDFLMTCEIDRKEAKDVAIMAWALDLSIQNEEENNVQVLL